MSEMTLTNSRRAGALAWLGVLLATTAALLGDGRDFSATWITTGTSTMTADFRIYTPPAIDVPRVRGVIFLYPGSGGDWRFRANDTVWQEAARSLGFAVIGAGSNAGYMSTTETQARASLAAILTAAAAVSGRAELVNAPIVSTGFSLGGFVSTEWVRHVPERTLAIVAHRGGWPLTGGAHLADSRKVHSLIVPGSLDDNGLTNAAYAADWYKTFRDTAIPDGRAAYAMDWLTPHDSFANQGWSMAWTWIAESIALRYPAGQVPSVVPGNPVALTDVTVASGWLGQRVYGQSTTGSDFSAFTPVAASAAYGASSPGVASWLPNETVARVYRAFNSYDGATGRAIPLQGPLAITGAAAPSTVIQAGQVNPPQMAVLPVGSAIDIACDKRGFGGGEVTVLAAQNQLANGDFSQWTSAKPDSWAAGTPAGVTLGPDLNAAGGAGSVVLRNNGSVDQTFTPLAADFQLRFTFTINLTPGNTGWAQPLVFNIYQANQAVNPTKSWMTFQFAAANAATGPVTIAAFTSDAGSSVVLPGPAITASSYDFTAGAFTGAPVKYDFVMNYFAASNTYSVSYGPSGGPLVSSGQVAYFRNPTNPSFGGLTKAFFFSYANGLVLDDVRVSAITATHDAVQKMDYYDGATLVGSQSAPGAAGWSLPYTLNVPGIRSLTVVAKDWSGYETSAFRTVVVAQPHPTGTTFYRFEPSPGLVTDHYDIVPLSATGTAGAVPEQVTLPASGPGAAFPRYFAFAAGENTKAARLTVASNHGFTSPDNASLPSGTTPFTIEAFVHLASSGTVLRTIAAHGGTSSSTNLGWQFVVTSEVSGQGARRLLLQFTPDGLGGVGTSLDTINSGFQLQTGVDYYVAVVVDPANTSASGIRFYLKDLTARGPLQVAERTHTKTSVWNSSAIFTVGNGSAGWDGLLDEVRLTKLALAPADLLINQATLPIPANLVVTAGAAPGQIQLNWSASASATSYQIERSTTAGTGFAVIAGIAATSFNDSGLAPGQAYYYRIRASDGTLVSSYSPESSGVPFLPATMAGWRYQYFQTNDNVAPADAFSDPDGDGMANLLEYATGTVPTNPASVAAPSIHLAASGGQVQFTFQRIADPAIIYQVQAAGELGGAWSDIWSSTGADNTAGPVTVTDPAAASNRRFLRLKITD